MPTVNLERKANVMRNFSVNMREPNDHLVHPFHMMKMVLINDSVQGAMEFEETFGPWSMHAEISSVGVRLTERYIIAFGARSEINHSFILRSKLCQFQAMRVESTMIAAMEYSEG